LVTISRLATVAANVVASPPDIPISDPNQVAATNVRRNVSVVAISLQVIVFTRLREGDA